MVSGCNGYRNNCRICFLDFIFIGFLEIWLVRVLKISEFKQKNN